MRPGGAGSGYGRGRGIGFRLSAVIMPAVGSILSIVAWTKWRPPLHVPVVDSQTHTAGALGPLGNGLAGSHGLATGHGTIGLVSAIACIGGIFGLFLPGRLRLVAAAVIAVSSAAMTANGLTAFLSANHLHQQWNTLSQAISSGASKPSLDGVSSAFTRRALAPSAAATAAGAVAFIGGLNTVRAALRSLRLAARPGSFGFPGVS